MQGTKTSWMPPPPPKCPRLLAQTLPRRPRRLRVKKSIDDIKRKRVCPPMQLIHPGVVTCLLSEAPRRLSPSRIPDGGGMLRIPRVFCPPAPLNRVEFPQRGIFEPTLPVLRVGRAGEDGGMPRSISPYRAWVIPPLLLPPACAGRIAVAARASPGLAPTPKPPRVVVIPTGDLKSPMDLVEDAMAVFSFPQELSSWLAAAFDFTCARPMRSGLGAIKPLRVNAPSPFPVPHPETGRNDEGTWTKNGSVFANFGEAPTQEFTAGMQEAMYDMPQNAVRPDPPSDVAPCVPVVSTPMLAAWASAGMAAIRSEQPNLVVGIDEAVSLTFEHVTAGFSLAGVTAKPPKPVKREDVMPRPMYITGPTAHGCTAGTSTQTLPSIAAGESFSGNEVSRVQTAGRPTWRDFSSNGDETVRSLNYYGPVWHDSDELSDAKHAASYSSHPWADAQKSTNRSLPISAAKRLPINFSGPRGVFSLDPKLRQRRTQYSTCVSDKLRTKHKAQLCGGKVRTTKAASSRRKQTTGEVVWKDALELPCGMLVETDGILADGACAEGPSGTYVHRISRYPPKIKDSIRTVHAGPVPARFPPREKKRESPPLRRMMHPLRARKVGRGTRSKALTLDDALPIVVQHRPGCTHTVQGRGRLFGNRNFLPLASSSASVWKSIASIPEDPPPPPRPRTIGRPHRKGRENTEQRRSFVSEGRANVAVSPRVPPGPWKTPPFS